MSASGDLAPGTREEALRALRTNDAEARRLVVRALGSAPSDAAVGVLRDVLGDEDWRVRKEAIQLAHALADHREVVPILVDALRAPAEEVALRNAAVEALAGLGATAVEAVESALHSDASAPFDADGRKLAIEVLAAARQVRSLKVVVRATDDPDANVRAAAAEAIGLIGGEDAASALLAILDREERLLRLIALEGLNRLGAPVPLARLSPLLSDRILRHAAIAALARTGDPEALAPLIEAASDPSRHVAETAMRAFASLHRVARPGAEAARALAAIGERGRERLRAAAASGEVAVRRGAIAMLAELGDEAAIATLVDVLADDELAEDAEQFLVALGPRALPALLSASHQGELGARTAAIRLLPRFARSDETLAALRTALRDPTAEVVAAAASAFTLTIASGATPTEADVRELLRAAARREPKVAATALQSLRSLARRRPEVVRPHLAEIETSESEAPIAAALLAVVGGPEHVPWLSRAVSAESPRTRRAAVEALGHIGGAAAARAIALAVTDEVPDVALAAIKALGRARDESGLEAPGVKPLLRLLASTDDPALLSAAVRALGSSGAAEAATALRPLVSSPSIAVSCAALEALAEIGVDDLPKIAFAALGHSSNVVVRAALDVLDALLADELPERRFEGAQLAAEVASALAHPAWEVRRRAVELLPRVGGPEVRALLRDRVAVETEPSVREALDRALAELEGRSAGDDGRDGNERGG